MHIFEKNIKNLELNIPSMALPVANYVPYKIFGKILYISGQAPIKEGSLIYKGKVGKDISEKEGITVFLAEQNATKALEDGSGMDPEDIELITHEK